MAFDLERDWMFLDGDSSISLPKDVEDYSGILKTKAETCWSSGDPKDLSKPGFVYDSSGDQKFDQCGDWGGATILKAQCSRSQSNTQKVAVARRKCSADALCITGSLGGVHGAYCAQACSAKEPCPDGLACLPLEGKKVSACVSATID